MSGSGSLQTPQAVGARRRMPIVLISSPRAQPSHTSVHLIVETVPCGCSSKVEQIVANDQARVQFPPSAPRRGLRAQIAGCNPAREGATPSHDSISRSRCPHRDPDRRARPGGSRLSPSKRVRDGPTPSGRSIRGPSLAACVSPKERDTAAHTYAGLSKESGHAVPPHGHRPRE